MIASMTGFGKASIEFEGKKVTAEIRSVNSRHLDINLRLPRALYELELPIKEFVRSKLERGKVSIYISLGGDESKSEQLTLDEENAKLYFKIANQLKKMFDLPGEIDLPLMLSLPDLITKEEEEIETESILGTIKQLLDAAIEDLNRMRYSEGESLAKDMTEKIAILEREISAIGKDSEVRIEEKKERLRERVEQLLGDNELEESRFATELVLLADRSDVNEECVRFHSHNQQFMEFLKGGSPVGKKLNFLLQEMHREANTIGAKINDSELTVRVITLKEEIEKLREQVQNLE